MVNQPQAALMARVRCWAAEVFSQIVHTTHNVDMIWCAMVRASGTDCLLSIMEYMVVSATINPRRRVTSRKAARREYLCLLLSISRLSKHQRPQAEADQRLSSLIRMWVTESRQSFTLTPTWCFNKVPTWGW